MKKVNIKDVIVTLLNEIKKDGTLKKFSTDYPKTWNVFPMVVYRTSSKPHFIDSDNNELQTKWMVTLEIYHDKSATEIANSIIQRFSDVRINLSEKDGNTADLRRIILESEFIVDNTLKIVYEK